MASTNLFLTIFLLEVIALTIFAKFSSTCVYMPVNRVNVRNDTSAQQPRYSHGLFGVLFFQF